MHGRNKQENVFQEDFWFDGCFQTEFVGVNSARKGVKSAIFVEHSVDDLFNCCRNIFDQKFPSTIRRNSAKGMNLLVYNDDTLTVTSVMLENVTA